MACDVSLIARSGPGRGPSAAALAAAAQIDRNVRKAGQFKETLALALSYRLF